VDEKRFTNANATHRSVRDRVTVDVHHVRNPLACPSGERCPRGDLDRGLQPRSAATVHVRAMPPALRPRQYHRTTTHRQAPRRSRTAAVADRSNPTIRAADPIRVGLHPQPPLTFDQLLRAHYESGQADTRGRATTTFDHGQGSLLQQMSDTCRMARPLTAFADTYASQISSHRPTLHRAEPPIQPTPPRRSQLRIPQTPTSRAPSAGDELARRS
jgi:hypothetical protein